MNFSLTVDKDTGRLLAINGEPWPNLNEAAAALVREQIRALLVLLLEWLPDQRDRAELIRVASPDPAGA